MVLLALAAVVLVPMLLLTTDFKKIIGRVYRRVVEPRLTVSFKEGIKQFGDGLQTLLRWRL
jgi:hypothetical protein